MKLIKVIRLGSGLECFVMGCNKTFISGVFLFANIISSSYIVEVLLFVCIGICVIILHY